MIQRNRMGLKLFERICQALRRRKDRQHNTHTKLVNDTSFYVDAGCYFIERSDVIYGYTHSAAVVKRTSFPPAHTPAQTPAIVRKKSTVDYNDDIGHLRRNAIFELCEEEREGLTMVLKGYIQQRNLKEFGML
uniref:Uncharacterized protein n=1 Tax=Clytia hemisphaerica TaxID=252671 RepID=A0A7M5UQX3_9CNID